MLHALPESVDCIIQQEFLQPQDGNIDDAGNGHEVLAGLLEVMIRCSEQGEWGEAYLKHDEILIVEERSLVLIRSFLYLCLIAALEI